MGDPSSTCLIPDLPDEISAQIIARVPRSHHRSLCHVSRSWRSLILSRHLFSLRSSLHCTEPTLYLNLRTKSHQSLWMALNRGHSHSNSLPSPPFPTVSSACATVGPFLFVLGGSLSDVRRSNLVQILDLHIGGRWFLGPRMSTARRNAAAVSLDGHMYAIGGCLPSSKAWAESLNLFDRNPEWVPIDSPVHVRQKRMHGCVVLSGQVLTMADGAGVAYRPGQDTGSCSTWGPLPKLLNLIWKGRAVVVNGIVYSYFYTGEIMGYDAGMDSWRSLLGIDEYLSEFSAISGALWLANLDGVLCVVWKHRSNENDRKEMMVDWMGIAVADLGSQGLYGSILWCETVALGVPCDSDIEDCVVAEF